MEIEKRGITFEVRFGPQSDRFYFEEIDEGRWYLIFWGTKSMWADYTI